MNSLEEQYNEAVQEGMENIYRQVDRFEMEDRIMECWNVTKDIETFLEWYELSDKEDCYMRGLQEKYNVLFEMLFKHFETMIKKGKIK